MIYFDNSATSPLLPEVSDAMLPYLYEEFGNPSSKYYTLAGHAQKAVETAREWVSELVGCAPDEVIFTSGSTESNNMVIKGVADYYQSKGNLIVTTKTEHPSILETTNYLAGRGFEILYLNVDSFGRINCDQVTSVLSDSPKPILVSVIWGNNELGSLNDINAIAQLCEENGVFFHTDATQVVGKVDISPIHSGINFLSMSSHKLHGPKGIGACVIRKHPLGFKTKITPLLHGGGQENDYRSGTLSVHNIVGFGKAAELACRNISRTNKYLAELELYLKDGLRKHFGSILHFNSDDFDKVPGIVNVRFDGINNELLIKKIAHEVAISTGSACSSSKPSHVLQNIGLSTDQIRSSVRVSLSRLNTFQEVDAFLQVLAG